MPIRQLPPLLVNQIAAGEVIERPASVVKEVVENAIDAGATRIDVAIEQGGCELIRISDNGCGIPMEELPLAIAPHATSKIQSADDLNSIATMGFRGEALASIASVSRMAITSRTAAQTGAGCIEVEGDVMQPVRPAAGPPGTTITVRNLFFNTPARRKFLRSEQTETGRVTDLLENLAIAHPSIAFSLKADDRCKFDLPPLQTPRQRVLAVIGDELAPELLEFQREERDLRLWGMAGKPAIARGTAKNQRVFLNGRIINDRSINHAIKEAYRGLIEPTRSPTLVLFITIDPAQVDVNVHPTKAEVRFRNQAIVHGAVMSAVRECLRRADLTPSLDVTTNRQWAPTFSTGLATANVAGSPPWSVAPDSMPHEAAQPSPAGFVEYFRRLNPLQKEIVYSEVKQAIAQDAPETLAEAVAIGSMPAADTGLLPTVRSVAQVLQVHSSYIVTQDEQGLLIIDQHALHERVMFEKLKARIAAGSLESQRLLLPAMVEVDRLQIQLLEELKPMLQRLGIDAEPLSPTAIAIHAFTSLLFERDVDPVTFMKELLDKAANRGVNHDPEAALHETLDMMACKAAVKAGDRLAPEELTELLQQRESIERASNCPHGRPTSLRLSIKELEKQFGRT